MFLAYHQFYMVFRLFDLPTCRRMQVQINKKQSAMSSGLSRIMVLTGYIQEISINFHEVNTYLLNAVVPN